MSLRQISVFVENKTGQLSEVTSLLSEQKINLRALSIADTSDFGILRIIVEDVDKAAQLLRENGFTYTVTEVLAVAMNDAPGGLAAILEVLTKAEQPLEYAYAFLVKKQDTAGLVVRVDDNQKATEALEAAGIKVTSQEELF